MKRAVAAGTSVFIVIITALIASLSHFYFLFLHFAADSLLHVRSSIIFAAPDVIIGAQLGVRLAQRWDHHWDNEENPLCSFYAH